MIIEDHQPDKVEVKDNSKQSLGFFRRLKLLVMGDKPYSTSEESVNILPPTVNDAPANRFDLIKEEISGTRK